MTTLLIACTILGAIDLAFSVAVAIMLSRSKSAPGGMSPVPPVNPREKKLCARPRSKKDNTKAL